MVVYQGTCVKYELLRVRVATKLRVNDKKIDIYQSLRIYDEFQRYLGYKILKSWMAYSERKNY